MKEITFTSLKNDFDAICDEVNQDKEAVTLTLKSNRKVYIMPEESYYNSFPKDSFFPYVNSKTITKHKKAAGVMGVSCRFSYISY